MDKANCLGCENNFYNGNNTYGVEECWSFKTAKLVKRKKVSINQRPPWKQKPGIYPDCYHCKGHVFVNGDRER